MRRLDPRFEGTQVNKKGYDIDRLGIQKFGKMTVNNAAKDQLGLYLLTENDLYDSGIGDVQVSKPQQ